MKAPVQFRWLGVAGIELTAGDQVLIVDPFFTRFPFWRMWWGPVVPDHALIAARVPRCDFVLVTHSHWDHLMDVPDVARNTGATVLGSFNTCQLLAILGVPANRIRQIRVGDEITLGDCRVTVLPAEHETLLGRPLIAGPVAANLRPPLRARDYRMDVCFSFLIEVAGHRLLYGPGENPHPSLPVTVQFVGPFAPRHYYKTVLRRVRPKLLVPVHWDDFFRPLSRPLRPLFIPFRPAAPTQFQKWIQTLSPETEVIYPEIFRTYPID